MSSLNVPNARIHGSDPRTDSFLMAGHFKRRDERTGALCFCMLISTSVTSDPRRSGKHERVLSLRPWSCHRILLALGSMGTSILERLWSNAGSIPCGTLSRFTIDTSRMRILRAFLRKRYRSEGRNALAWHCTIATSASVRIWIREIN